MKSLEKITFDAKRAKRELLDLGSLLAARSALDERREIKPVFRKSPQLAAFLGTYAPNVVPADRLAYEFQIAGDFGADIVVGNHATNTYCMIELEDARRNSVFATSKSRSTMYWSSRFEHGFSQLVDWFWKLDDIKKTVQFANIFGHGHARFHGLLIIGRLDGLEDND